MTRSSRERWPAACGTRDTAVDVAGDGDAVLQAAVWDYDAIVLDVMLPQRDGLAVCAALRERGCWAPVLIVTARDQVPDRVRGPDAGADDYLGKPVAFDELRARLRALMRRAPAERPARPEVGDLVVDPGTSDVTRAGHADRADRTRVRRARVPRAPRRPGGHPHAAARACLGRELHRRDETSSTSTSGLCATSSSGRSTGP